MQASGNNEKDLQPDPRESVSAEGGNKSKKRERAVKVKSQRKFLKSDKQQNKAHEGRQSQRTYSTKNHANRREKGASSAILTQMNYQNNSSGILDRNAKNYDYLESAKRAIPKKVIEVSTTLEKDPCAASEKKKVNSFTTKTESYARRKKFGSGPNCNQESNFKKSQACSSHVSDAEVVQHESKTASKKFRCAFCQSSECSEVLALLISLYNNFLSFAFIFYQDGS